MENKDRPLTAEERLWIIKEALNNDSLSGVLEAVNKRFGLNQEIKTDTTETRIKNNVEDVEVEESAQVVSNDNIQNSVVPNKFETITESGMYRQEALPAVLEDLANAEENAPVDANTQPKTRILENSNIPVIPPETPVIKAAPNPWEDAKHVRPGQ